MHRNLARTQAARELVGPCKRRFFSSALVLAARLVACGALLVTLCACGTGSPRAQTLIPIGGGLERANTISFDAMLAHTRPGTRIVIAPFASGEADEAFARARDNFLFHDPSASIERMADPTQGAEQLALATQQIASAQLIFMTGGDQSRLTPRFRDASGELNAAGRAMYRSDLVVAGTSAGAAIMAHPMFTGGGSESALANLPSNDADEPASRGVRLGTGLGVSGNLLIDTHVLVRGRYGRIFAALKKGDHIAALGLADASAAVVLRSEDAAHARILHDHGAILCFFDGQQRAQSIGTIDVGEGLGARVSLLCEGDVVNIAYGMPASWQSRLLAADLQPGDQSAGGRGGKRHVRVPQGKIEPAGKVATSVPQATAQANTLRSERADAAHADGKPAKDGAWDEGVLVDCLLRVAAEPSKAFTASSERFTVRVWSDEETKFFVKDNGAVTVWKARLDITLKDDC